VNIRSSNTDRFVKCPASVLAGGAGSWNAAADLGTAGHLAAARIVNGAEPETAALALAYQVDANEMDFLVGQAYRMWGWLREYFPTPETEVSMASELSDDLQLTGTADVIAGQQGGDCFVLDWKSGRRETDATAQLLSYALLAAQQYDATRAYIAVAWLRTGEIDAQWIDLAAIGAWKDRLLDAAKRAKASQYATGEQCIYCPAAATCEALRRKSLAFRDDPQESDDENVVELHALRQTWERLASDLTLNVKAHLATRPGGVPLTDGSGRVLKLCTDSRSSIDFAKAVEWLMDTYPDHWVQACSLSKGALEKAIGASCERGQKGNAIKAALAYLDTDLGAITRTEFDVVRLTKGDTNDA